MRAPVTTRDDLAREAKELASGTSLSKLIRRALRERCAFPEVAGTSVRHPGSLIAKRWQAPCPQLFAVSKRPVPVPVGRCRVTTVRSSPSGLPFAAKLEAVAVQLGNTVSNDLLLGAFIDLQ